MPLRRCDREWIFGIKSAGRTGDPCFEITQRRKARKGTSLRDFRILAFYVYFAIAEIKPQFPGSGVAELRNRLERREDEPIFQASPNLSAGQNVKSAHDFIIDHSPGFIDDYVDHYIAATARQRCGGFYRRRGGQ